jgi:hypothetical protein
MNSVSVFATSSPTVYPSVARSSHASDGSRPREAAGGSEADPSSPASRVTLSRRAQELAAREASEQTRTEAEMQRMDSASDAAQEARRVRMSQADDVAAQHSDAASPRAQAVAQLRRAYAEPQGSVAR